MARAPRTTPRQAEPAPEPPTYRQIFDPMTNAPHEQMIQRIEDGAFIPFDDGNADYQIYKAWLAEGHQPEQPPPQPEPPPPTIVSHRQFFQALAMGNVITQDEALAAVQTGTIPAAMAQFIDTLSPQEQFAAKMLIAGAGEFDRHHPLTEKFAEFAKMTPEEADDLWRLAASL